MSDEYKLMQANSPEQSRTGTAENYEDKGTADKAEQLKQTLIDAEFKTNRDKYENRDKAEEKVQEWINDCFAPDKDAAESKIQELGMHIEELAETNNELRNLIGEDDHAGTDAAEDLTAMPEDTLSGIPGEDNYAEARMEVPSKEEVKDAIVQAELKDPGKSSAYEGEKDKAEWVLESRINKAMAQGSVKEGTESLARRITYLQDLSPDLRALGSPQDLTDIILDRYVNVEKERTVDGEQQTSVKEWKSDYSLLEVRWTPDGKDVPAVLERYDSGGKLKETGQCRLTGGLYEMRFRDIESGSERLEIRSGQSEGRTIEYGRVKHTDDDRERISFFETGNDSAVPDRMEIRDNEGRIIEHGIIGNVTDDNFLVYWHDVKDDDKDTVSLTRREEVSYEGEVLNTLENTAPAGDKEARFDIDDGRAEFVTIEEDGHPFAATGSAFQIEDIGVSSEWNVEVRDFEVKGTALGEDRVNVSRQNDSILITTKVGQDDNKEAYVIQRIYDRDGLTGEFSGVETMAYEVRKSQIKDGAERWSYLVGGREVGNAVVRDGVPQYGRQASSYDSMSGIMSGSVDLRGPALDAFIGMLQGKNSSDSVEVQGRRGQDSVTVVNPYSLGIPQKGITLPENGVSFEYRDKASGDIFKGSIAQDGSLGTVIIKPKDSDMSYSVFRPGPQAGYVSEVEKPRHAEVTGISNVKAVNETVIDRFYDRMADRLSIPIPKEVTVEEKAEIITGFLDEKVPEWQACSTEFIGQRISELDGREDSAEKIADQTADIINIFTHIDDLPGEIQEQIFEAMAEVADSNDKDSADRKLSDIIKGLKPDDSTQAVDKDFKGPVIADPKGIVAREDKLKEYSQKVDKWQSRLDKAPAYHKETRTRVCQLARTYYEMKAAQYGGDFKAKKIDVFTAALGILNSNIFETIIIEVLNLVLEAWDHRHDGKPDAIDFISEDGYPGAGVDQEGKSLDIELQKSPAEAVERTVNSLTDSIDVKVRDIKDGWEQHAIVRVDHNERGDTVRCENVGRYEKRETDRLIEYRINGTEIATFRKEENPLTSSLEIKEGSMFTYKGEERTTFNLTAEQANKFKDMIEGVDFNKSVDIPGRPGKDGREATDIVYSPYYMEVPKGEEAPKELDKEIETRVENSDGTQTRYQLSKDLDVKAEMHLDKDSNAIEIVKFRETGTGITKGTVEWDTKFDPASGQAVTIKHSPVGSLDKEIIRDKDGLVSASDVERKAGPVDVDETQIMSTDTNIREDEDPYIDTGEKQPTGTDEKKKTEAEADIQSVAAEEIADDPPTKATEAEHNYNAAQSHNETETEEPQKEVFYNTANDESGINDALENGSSQEAVENTLVEGENGAFVEVADHQTEGPGSDVRMESAVAEREVHNDAESDGVEIQSSALHAENDTSVAELTNDSPVDVRGSSNQESQAESVSAGEQQGQAIESAPVDDRVEQANASEDRDSDRHPVVSLFEDIAQKWDDFLAGFDKGNITEEKKEEILDFTNNVKDGRDVTEDQFNDVFASTCRIFDDAPTTVAQVTAAVTEALASKNDIGPHEAEDAYSSVIAAAAYVYDVNPSALEEGVDKGLEYENNQFGIPSDSIMLLSVDKFDELLTEPGHDISNDDFDSIIEEVKAGNGPDSHIQNIEAAADEYDALLDKIISDELNHVKQEMESMQDDDVDEMQGVDLKESQTEIPMDISDTGCYGFVDAGDTYLS